MTESRRPRRRRLTFANVAAALALFLALGGGAYAASALQANSVGTKQIRNGAVTLSKIAKSARKALRGNAGPMGAKGDTGPQGVKGAKGDTGPAGPITGTLPSGVTLTGTFFVADLHNTGVDAPIDTTISFPLALPAGVTPYAVSAYSPSSPCTGTAANPTAPPGDLCVYAAVLNNVRSDSGHATFVFVDPATNTTTTTTRPFGVVVRANAFDPGAASAYGSWAVTAP